MHNVPTETQVLGIGNGFINESIIRPSIRETQLLTCRKEVLHASPKSPTLLAVYFLWFFPWKDEGQSVSSEYVFCFN